jgi:hypothetical protein
MKKDIFTYFKTLIKVSALLRIQNPVLDPDSLGPADPDSIGSADPDLIGSADPDPDWQG